jgi:hypothetical protein
VRLSIISLAAAAGLIIAVLVRRPGDAAPAAGAVAARLEEGAVLVDNGPLSRGDAIRANATVSTGAGRRATLRLGNGAELRLDADSAVRFPAGAAAGTVALDRGALFVHTGSTAAERRSVEIRTAAGVARDIGTSFEVRVIGDATRVRVRDGIVQLVPLVRTGGDAAAHTAGRGVELLATRHGCGAARRRDIRAGVELDCARRAAARSGRQDAAGLPRLGRARGRLDDALRRRSAPALRVVHRPSRIDRGAHARAGARGHPADVRAHASHRQRNGHGRPRERTVKHCVAWLLLTAMGAGSAAAQSSAEAKYVGRPLADVLREIQAGGVKLVYSTELVRPELLVVAEPRARAPRKRIDELLKPHGLETRDGPNGTILVVTRARTPKAAKPPAAAPGAGSIGGRVLDATTAAPLAGVVVEVQTTGHSVRTDDHGRFVLAGIPAGRHPLFVSTIGYGLARPVVDVRAGARTELDVPLAEGTGAYTERVTVTADPLAVPTAGAPAQETLGSASLQGVRAVLIDDPLRAVQSLPGVAANDDMRSDFSVRGSDFRHVGTSIDGVATPWLLHEFQENSDSGSLSVLNSDILDRVTLSLGAYPQRYSDRTGAWLESTMREGSRAATAFRAAVSGTNASVLAEGPIGAGAGGSWLVSFRRSYLDWLIRRIVPDFGSSLFAFTDLQSKVVYDLTPRHQLQMIAIAGAARLDQPDERDISSTAHAADDMALGTVALRSTLGSSWLVTQRVALVGQKFRNDNPSGTVNDDGRVLDLSYRAISPGRRAPTPRWKRARNTRGRTNRG